VINITKLERVAGQQNRVAREALYFLRLIEDGLDNESFSVQDIKDAFCDQTKGLIADPKTGDLKKCDNLPSKIVFNRAHLEYLLEQKLIISNEDSPETFRSTNADLSDDLDEFYRNQEEFN